MALIVKKGKEEDSERPAVEPHLSSRTTWHLFPNM